MSYDLNFAIRPSSQAPGLDAVRAWLEKRAHWRDVASDNPRYENEATGVTMDLGFHESPGEGEDADRAPFHVYISGLRPHVVALELAEELAALVDAFDVLVNDPSDGGMGKGAFTTDGFLRSWTAYSEIDHRFSLAEAANDPPPVLSRDRLEDAWRWNRARDAFADRLGDDVFVPSIHFAADDDPEAEVKTYVAWADGTAARVPRVDSIVTPRKHVAWSAIEEAIGAAKRSEEILPHFVVDGDVLARVFEAIERAPALGMPRAVAVGDVCTKDLVDPHRMPAEERAKIQRATKLMLHAQAARFMGDRKDAIRGMREATELVPRAAYLRELATVAHEAEDHVTAFEAASRAFALEPHAFSALLGAANGAYAARYAEALELADRLLELSPGDRNAHVLRAVCLTDLARYDEAISAADEALAIDHEPMVENVKAYALAAAGREKDARAAYEHALADLDAALAAGSDEAAELHSRRAWSLLGLGRAKEAVAAAKASLKLEKDAFLALQSLGRALVAAGKPKEALAPLARAVVSRHAAPMASFHAAQAHAALGDETAAAKALRGACVSPHFEKLAREDASLAALVDKSSAELEAKAANAPAKKTSAKRKKKAPARS